MLNSAVHSEVLSVEQGGAVPFSWMLTALSNLGHLLPCDCSLQVRGDVQGERNEG